MKRLRLAFLILAIRAARVLAQPAAVPLPNDIYHNSGLIYTARGDTVLATPNVPYYEAPSWLLRSVDTGKTFSVLDSGLGPAGYVYFFGSSGPIYRASTSYRANPEGNIEISLDRGSTWQHLADSLYNNSYGTYAVSSDGHCFVASTYMVTDHNTIRQIWNGGDLGSIRNESWCDSLHGLIFTQNYLVITADGGKHWRTIFSADSNDDPLLIYSTSVTYHTPWLLTALRNSGRQWISRDTGQTWNENDTIGSGFIVLSPNRWFSYRDTLIQDTLLLSTDAGKTWLAGHEPPLGIDSTSFSDSLSGIGLGAAGFWRTADGGLNWRLMQPQYPFLDAPVGNPSFMGSQGLSPGGDKNTYFMFSADTLGEDEVISSHDRGKTWQKFLSIPPSFFRYYTHNGRFYFIVGDSVLWTMDGGAYHLLGRLGPDPTEWKSQWFVKFGIDQTVWAGSAHKLVISVDGGTNSRDVSANVPNIGTDSAFTFIPVDASTGLARESNGEVFETIDTGATWGPVADSRPTVMPTLIAGESTWFRDIDTTPTHSATPYIMTTDAGTRWDTTDYGRGFSAFDSLRWVDVPANQNGTYTTDGGYNWQPIPGWMYLPLISIDSNAAFFGNGTWLWRLDMPWYVAQQGSVKEQLVGPVASASASPNPATGRVTLSFSLPAPGTVSVTVLNVLGEVVRELPSPHPLPKGEGEMQVDLSKLPAGIYYARIVAGKNATATMVKVVKE